MIVTLFRFCATRCWAMWFLLATSSCISECEGVQEGVATVKITQPINGVIWAPGMAVLVDVNVSSAANIQANPHLYVVCTAGDLESSEVVGGGALNCAPVLDENGNLRLGDDPLFAHLKVAKPLTFCQLEGISCLDRAHRMSGGAVSEVRVWLQHYSHLRHPSSALSPAARSVAFVLAPTKEEGGASVVAEGVLAGSLPLDVSEGRSRVLPPSVRALETAKAVIRELEARLEMASSRATMTPNQQQQQQQQQRGLSHRSLALSPPPLGTPLAPLGGGRWASWSAALAFSGLGFEDVPNLHLALAKAHTEAAEVAAEARGSVAVSAGSLKGSSSHGHHSASVDVGDTNSSGAGKKLSGLPGLDLDRAVETNDEEAILAFIQKQAVEKDDQEGKRPVLGSVPQMDTLFDEEYGGEGDVANEDEASGNFPLFPCSVPTSEFDRGGQVALRLHFERPPAFPFGGGFGKTKPKEQNNNNASSSSKEGYVPLSKNSTKIPRYIYLQSPIPLPPRVPGVVSINLARELLAPALKDTCEGAYRGTYEGRSSDGPVLPMAPGWGVEDCTLDLLEQLTERIVFLCTPPAKPPSTCSKQQEKKQQQQPPPPPPSSAPSEPRQDRNGPREHYEHIHSEGGEEDEITAAASGVDLSLVKECLVLTHSRNSGREGVGQLDVDSLAYPDDAEEHFEEIQQALRPWSSLRPGHRPHHAAAYSGPWIENAWIESAYNHVNPNNPPQSTAKATRLESRVPPSFSSGGLSSEPLRSWQVVSEVVVTSHGEEGTSPSLPWQSWWQPPRRSFCLKDKFGPFIPILLPWTDLWEPEGMHGMPPDLLPTLRRILRPTVPYVTVVQHASGLALACEANFNELFPNILVLSAGGFGHVPIPLLKQTEPQNNFRPFTSPSPAAALAAVASATAQVASESRTQTSAEDLRRSRFEPGLEGDGNLEVEESEVGDSSQGSSVNLKGSKRNTPETISVIEAWAMSMAAEASSSLPAAVAAQWGVPRTHLVSYVGTPHNAPGELRAHMIQAMFSTAMKLNESAAYYKGNNWRDVMADSIFSLCPRGVGRTAYHLMETLQMGLLPIHVHLSEEVERITSGTEEESEWEYEHGVESWVPYELSVFRERKTNPKEGRGLSTEDKLGSRSDAYGLGWSTSLANLPLLLERLSKLSSESSVQTRQCEGEENNGGDGNACSSLLAAREAEVVALRESHFTTNGALGQIHRFLTTSQARTHFRRRRKVRRRRHQTSSSEEGRSPLENEESNTGSWEEDTQVPWRVSAAGSDLVCRALPVYPTVGEAHVGALPEHERSKRRAGRDYDGCRQCEEANSCHVW